MYIVQEALGSPPALVKTKDATAHFIEVISVQNCIADSILVPKRFTMSSVVEAVVSAKKLDDALIAFIKRIVEDAFQAERSKFLVASDVRVLSAGKSSKDFSFHITEIRTNRVKVVSALKEAIVAGSEIGLEIFVSAEASAIASSLGAKLNTSSFQSFAMVHRRYNLTYVDAENGEIRCFAQIPIESLISGVFIDLEEAHKFRSFYTAFSKRRGKSGTSTASSSSSAGAKDPGINEFTNHLSTSIMNSLEKVDISVVVENLLVLHCCLTLSNNAKTFLLQQLIFLGTGLVGKLVAAKEAVYILRKSLEMFAARVQRCPEEVLRSYDTATDVFDINTGSMLSEEEEEVRTLRLQYGYLSSHFDSVRRIIRDILVVTPMNEPMYSEFEYIKSFLPYNLWKLFDSESQRIPVIQVNPWRVSSNGLSGVHIVFASLDEPLRTTEAALTMCASSIGLDMLCELLVKDQELFVAAQQAASVAANPKKRIALSLNAPLPPPPVLSKVYFSFKTTPRLLNELLGYAIARASGTGTWSPIIYNEKSIYSNVMSLAVENDRIDASKFHKLWEYHSALRWNWPGRHGAIDYQASLIEMLCKAENAVCITSEAVLLRYLSECNVVSALQKAYFEVLTQPDSYSPYATLCFELFPRSSEINLFGLPCTSLSTQLRRNTWTTQKYLKYLYGACRLPVGTLGVYQGGIIGPTELVVNGIGDCERIYKFMWTMPCVFSHPASISHSYKVDMYMGLAFDSALSISKPMVYRPQATTSVRDSERNSPRRNTSIADIDPDNGLISNAGLIQLESVIKIEFKTLDNEEEVRGIFADEVIRSIEFLESSSLWILQNILIGTDSADLYTAREMNSARVIPAENLKTASTLKSLKRTLFKNGEALVEACFPIPHDILDLPFDDLMTTMRSFLEQNRGGNGSNMTSFSTKEAQVEQGKEEDDMWGLGSDDKFRATATMDSDNNWQEIDPTVKEKTRVYSSSVEKQRVQLKFEEHLASNAGAMTYLPCTIRFTLLGVCLSSSGYGRKSKFDLKKGTSPVILDRNSSDSIAQWLCIGRDETVASLVSSTLWFSLDAGRAIWGAAAGATEGAGSSTGGRLKVAKRPAMAPLAEEGTEQPSVMLAEADEYKLSSNITNCIKFEAAKRWRRAKALKEQEQFFEAYSALYIPLLFSPVQDKSTFCVRMMSGLPSKFKAAVGNVPLISAFVFLLFCI